MHNTSTHAAMMPVVLQVALRLEVNGLADTHRQLNIDDVLIKLRSPPGLVL